MSEEATSPTRNEAVTDGENFVGLASRMAFEESSSATVPVLRAEARRFHECRSGVVTVLFILLSLVFFCSGALIWNTGRTVSAKVHTQMAADTAAFTAAQWNARCVNNIVGSNMLIMRQAAAISNSFAVGWTLIWIPIKWAKKIKDAYDACCAPCLIACAICGGACALAVTAYILAVELAPYLSFLGKALPPALSEGIGGISDIGTLYDYQQAWVAALPAVIDKERQNVEDYYGVKIRLTTPGVGAVGNGNVLSGGISPPLKEAGLAGGAAISPFLLYRFTQVDTGWPKDSWEFPLIQLGEAKKGWQASTVPSVAAGSLATFGRFHILPTYWGPVEFGPTSVSDWEDFQVVALASEAGVAENKLVAPGLFNRGVAPSDTINAVATGEVYNGIDGRVSSLGFSIPWPFRMWTTWGWQWQPRLGRSSEPGNTTGALIRAMEYDSTLKGLIKGVDTPSGLKSVPMH